MRTFVLASALLAGCQFVVSPLEPGGGDGGPPDQSVALDQAADGPVGADLLVPGDLRGADLSVVVQDLSGADLLGTVIDLRVDDLRVDDLLTCDGKCSVACSAAMGCGVGAVCCPGSGGACLGDGGGCSGTCTTGDCCVDADCAARGRLCKGNTCLACTQDSECGGGHCCAGGCYPSCVITIAGNGRSGAPDALVASARINGVLGVLPDTQGNVLFTDYRSNAVRLANFSSAPVGGVPAGSVGRVAGGIFGCNPGAALASEMRQPQGLARDGVGDIYITDFQCQVVWKLSADLQTVTVLAGQPAIAGYGDGTGSGAAFHGPIGIAFSPTDGFLYVTDYFNNRVRRVSTTGVVTTVAGSGMYADGDGPALAVGLAGPMAIINDATGALFVGEETGHLRQLTGAGTGGAMLGTAYVAGPGVAFTGGTMGILQNKIYATIYNLGVQVLTPPSTPFGMYTAAPLGSGPGSYSDAIDPLSTMSVWVGGFIDGANTSVSNTLSRRDLSGSATLSVGQPGASGIADGAALFSTFVASCMGGIAVDAAGDVWVTDRCAHRVRKLAANGTVTSFGNGEIGGTGGTAATARFAYPAPITIANNTVYTVNEYGDQHVMMIDIASSMVTQGPLLQIPLEVGPSIVISPGGLVVDGAGDLYVTTYNTPNLGPAGDNPMIVKIPAGAGGMPGYFAGKRGVVASMPAQCVDGGLGTGVFGKWPYGLARDQAGNLYVGDGVCGVRKVSPTGVITTLGAATAIIGMAIGPGKTVQEVLYGSDGSGVYTIDLTSGARTLAAGGQFSLTSHYADGPATTGARLWAPFGLTVDSRGYVYIADLNNARLRLFYPF